jgi:hypothetical protein
MHLPSLAEIRAEEHRADRSGSERSGQPSPMMPASNTSQHKAVTIMRPVAAIASRHADLVSLAARDGGATIQVKMLAPNSAIAAE